MLLAGRRGFVIGVSNKHSLAWSVACAWRNNGADDVVIGVQNYKRLAPVVQKLAHIESNGKWTPLVVECNVNNDSSMSKCFDSVKDHFSGKLNMLLHSVAFAPKESLKGDNEDFSGLFALASREGFIETMETSVYSFIALGQMFSPLLKAGAASTNSSSSLTTLTFDACTRVVPQYGIMGPAKGALETCCRYGAWEFGKDLIRVNSVSAGPVNTLAARGIPGLLDMRKLAEEKSPLKRSIKGEDVGDTCVYLASDLASAVTGPNVVC